MLETKLTQIVVEIPSFVKAKISGQPESLIDNVNVVTAREGKSTKNLPHPNQAGKAVVSESKADEEEGS